jgi:hypothetical protein
MRLSKIFIFLLTAATLAAVISFFTTGLVYAVPLTNVAQLANNSQIATYTSFSEVLLVALRVLLTLAFVVSLIYVVLSGYRLVTSQGNEDQLGQAKKSLLWAVLGCALIAASYVALNFVVTIARTGTA